MPHHNRRLTIGLLADNFLDPRFYHIWAGLVDAAKEYDVNLISFNAGTLNSERALRMNPGRVLCDFIEPDRLDGIVTCSTSPTAKCGPR